MVRQPWEPPYVRHYPGFGWYQGRRHLRNFKPSYAWIRPHDGKRKGWVGGLKDIATGQGPDYFLGINGDRRTRDCDFRPSRGRWSRWDQQGVNDHHLLDEDGLMNALPAMPWARRRGKAYDFRPEKRKYRYPTYDAWTDVRWPEHGPANLQNPRAKRDIYGRWAEADMLGPWEAGWHEPPFWQ
ncbi:hypothetical protein BJ546DRAFT_841522 [Cryomyces antarcticus]